jgi:hypothetical protein
MQIYTTTTTRNQIEALAKLRGLSMSATIAELVEDAYQRYHLVAVTTLPHPDGAQEVQIAEVTK